MRATVFVHSTKRISRKKCEKIKRKITKTLIGWYGPPAFHFPRCQRLRGRRTIHLQIQNLAFITHEPEEVKQHFAGHFVDDVNDVFPKAYVQCNIEAWPEKQKGQALGESNTHRHKNRIKVRPGKVIY